MSAEKLVQNLKKNKLNISSVESCTGGYLINSITNIEGASHITNGGIVAYSNSQKIRIGVSKEIIKKYGVYSKECAQNMAKVGLELFDSNISVGITGTLSNIDENNRDSEQGKVFYCISIREKDEITNLQSELDLVIEKRCLQKKYIVSIIIESLLEYLQEDYQ